MGLPQLTVEIPMVWRLLLIAVAIPVFLFGTVVGAGTDVVAPFETSLQRELDQYMGETYPHRWDRRPDGSWLDEDRGLVLAVDDCGVLPCIRWRGENGRVILAWDSPSEFVDFMCLQGDILLLVPRAERCAGR